MISPGPRKTVSGPTLLKGTNMKNGQTTSIVAGHRFPKGCHCRGMLVAVALMGLTACAGSQPAQVNEATLHASAQSAYANLKPPSAYMVAFRLRRCTSQTPRIPPPMAPTTSPARPMNTAK